MPTKKQPALFAKRSDEDLARMTVDDAAHEPASLLGAIADEWWQVKQERLAADKVAEALKQRENLLQSALIAQCNLQKITGVGGQVVRVGVEKEEQPTVKDWTKFYAYIKANDAFDLLERRAGKGAVKARWEDGITIPGVEKFPVYKLSKQGVK